MEALVLKELDAEALLLNDVLSDSLALVDRLAEVDALALADALALCEPLRLSDADALVLIEVEVLKLALVDAL